MEQKRCGDSNRQEYSWYSSLNGNLSSAKRECELHENCVGIQWGVWNSKGLILVDGSRLAGVDGDTYSRNKKIEHVNKGIGPIVTVGNRHTASTCYAYRRDGKAAEYINDI